MNKLILSDLDLTLVNKSLEIDFLKYLFNNSNVYKNSINLFYWTISRLFLHKNRRDYFKFFYYKYSKMAIDEAVKSWLKNVDLKDFKINDSIIKTKKEGDLFFVLTNCPSFISIPFCAKFLPNVVDYVFATLIHEKNNIYHYRVRRKVYDKNKMRIAKKLLAYFPYKSIGYGDSETDIPFMSLCEESVLIDFR